MDSRLRVLVYSVMFVISILGLYTVTDSMGSELEVDGSLYLENGDCVQLEFESVCYTTWSIFGYDTQIPLQVVRVSYGFSDYDYRPSSLDLHLMILSGEI